MPSTGVRVGEHNNNNNNKQNKNGSGRSSRGNTMAGMDATCSFPVHNTGKCSWCVV